MAKCKGKSAAGEPDGPSVTFRKLENDNGFDDVLDTLAAILIDNAERRANNTDRPRRRSTAA